MNLYMLDTNILTDIVRDPDGEAARQFAGLGSQEVCISVVVSSEVLFGLARKAGTRATARIVAMLATLQVMPFEPPADAVYAELRAELAKRGRGLTPNDYFIAAHAKHMNAILVTGDRAIHDAEIPGLRIENWLRSAA
jgi:tRNA(fMet)-specific endonuclease VapC